jgi:carbon-monoxide dehydrogenase iron sulfur subunit
MQYGRIIVNPHRCVACHTCELVCSIAHSQSGTLVGMLREETKPAPRVFVGKLDGRATPVHCRHCDDAPCATVCPVDAISRKAPGEPVILDWEKCTGCGSCPLACPYGVLSMIPFEGKKKKVTEKCDLCIKRLEKGIAPACAMSCPTAAIEFAASAKPPDAKYLVDYTTDAKPTEPEGWR